MIWLENLEDDDRVGSTARLGTFFLFFVVVVEVFWIQNEHCLSLLRRRG